MINLTTKIAIKIGKWYIKMLDRFLALARRFRRRRKFLENRFIGTWCMPSAVPLHPKKR